MISVNGFVAIYSDGKSEYEYKGLHTDQKPTDCATNSLFFELDTGDFYYFNGTTWSKVGGSATPTE